MIKLFWCKQTRSSRIVWMLEELQLPYERINIDIRTKGATDSPEFQAASPMRKVPAIQDGEVSMADSAAICLYLADRYPATHLAPPIDDALRGKYLYWMTYTPGVVEPAMTEKANGYKPNRGQNGWGDFDSMIAVLKAGIGEGPWLLGEHFSAADVMVGSSVCFMRMFGMLPDDAVLNAYADRCLARADYQKALALEA